MASVLRDDRHLRTFLLALSRAAASAEGLVFLAGGFLRDIAAGAPAGDIDVMVAGISHRALGKMLGSLPRATLGVRNVVSAGIRFPVYRVATGWNNRYVDVSVARGGAKNRRRTAMGCALEDAAHRDFTVNSLLYRLSRRRDRLYGDLFDPFGGIADLSKRMIRCVGSAEDRLREDPLRALRALRMKNEREGWRIHAATWRAVRRLGPQLLPAIPPERIVGELLRSLAASPAGTIEDLRRSGIARALLPELSRPRGREALAALRCRLLVRSAAAPIIPATILLASLLADLGPEEAEAAARRLRFPNVRRVLRTLSDLRALRHSGGMRFPYAETESILARQEEPGSFIALYMAMKISDGEPAGNLRRLLRLCSKVPVLVKGTDLEERGFPEGPGRKEALLAIREATLRGRIRSRAEALRRVTRLCRELKEYNGNGIRRRRRKETP